MRTDDFNGPKSQDNFENRPDAQDDIRATMESEDETGDGFSEFDAPLPGQNTSAGNSLGEMWRNNPIIKIVVVVVAIVAVMIGLVMFGGDKADGPESQVGTAVDEREAPGQETSEAYRDAINEVNDQRLENALATGDSTMPIPVASPDTTPALPATEEPPVTLDDPLEGWRGTQQDVPPPTLDPTSPQMMSPEQQAAAAAARGPMGPDPAAVDALAGAMSGQMQSILAKHAITGPQIMAVTPKDYFSKAEGPNIGGTGTDGAGSAEIEIQEILIPAGTIVYAQTLTESNTDAPGPVLARLSSGPLAGSRILGTFNDTDEYLRLEFNTVVVKGISQPTNAVALDPKTTLPAVVTDVDRRYWRRVIFPAAARFVEGMGRAVAQREQTVTVNNGTTVSSTPDLNAREELAAGLADGTSELAQELDREGDRTKVMIKVHAGTPIGILFLEPVIKQTEPSTQLNNLQ